MIPSRLGRLLRFGLVGVVGAAIHIGSFELIRWGTGLEPAPSWLLSFLVAASAGWFMNRQFTFRVDPSQATTGEWLRYVAVAGLGALAHFIVFMAAVRFVPLFQGQPGLAIIPGSLASLCVTYAGSALFVFASARKRP